VYGKDDKSSGEEFTSKINTTLPFVLPLPLTIFASLDWLF